MSVEREQQPNSFDDRYHNDDYIKRVFAGADRNDVPRIKGHVDDFYIFQSP